jgi:hypothetical protein
MNPFKYISILVISFFLIPNLFSQNTQKDFGELLQSYFLTKDKAIVEKSISYFNSTSSIENLKPVLVGFFVAIFSEDQFVKNNFSQGLGKLIDTSNRDFFRFLLTSNIDSIYLKTPISPSFNDMNWASFFSTGNTKFLDNIISNLSYCNNLTELNLFLTGNTAKWSLCSNAKQYDKVNNYLKLLKEKNPIISDLLTKEPDKIQKEMITILKEQKAKGVWQ